MRILFSLFSLLFALTACGYRTPLALPKPDAKPASTTPAAPAKADPT